MNSISEKELENLKNDLAYAKSQFSFWKKEIKNIQRKIKTFNPNFTQLEMEFTNEY